MHPPPTTLRLPIKPLPSWFYYLINSPAPEYYAFCTMVASLNHWEYLTEVEHLHCYAEKQRKIHNEVEMLNAELQYMNNKFAAC